MRTSKKSGELGDLPSKSPKLEPIDPDLSKAVTAQVMETLESATRKLIVHKDARHYSTRESQKAAVGFLAALVNHTTYRQRFVEAALNNPMQAMSLAIQTLPKEIMVENHTYLEKVEIFKPDAISLAAWMQGVDAKAQILEVVPLENPKEESSTFQPPVHLVRPL